MGKCSIKESFIRMEQRRGLRVRACTSVPMKKGIFSIKIHCGSENSCSISQEIRKLLGKIKEKGMTLVPLKVYFKGEPGEGGDRSCKRKETLRQEAGHRQRKTRQERHKETSRSAISGRFKRKRKVIIEMVPVTKKEDLRNLGSPRPQKRLYEELTPQLIQLDRS